MASRQTITRCTESVGSVAVAVPDWLSYELLRRTLEVWQQFYPEREGFSLAVQEDALRNFATKEGGEIVKQFRIAETANKTDAQKLSKLWTGSRQPTRWSKSF